MLTQKNSKKKQIKHTSDHKYDVFNSNKSAN